MSRVRGAAAPPSGFRRHSVTGWGLFFLGVSASAPETAVVGGIVGAYAAAPGVVAVPAAFMVLTVALALFSVGYVSMAREIRHAGPLYAHVARGLGPVRGVSAATVSLLSYNAIQICLYGLLGATLADFGWGPWWLWALLAWATVALFGVLEVVITAKVLAGLLCMELVVVIAFVVFALTHPADGVVDVAPLLPVNPFGDGAGSVFALSVACFVGVETILAFNEEAVSHKTLARACVGALAFLGVLYTLAAWAVAAAAGTGDVAEVASRGPAVVFDVLLTRAGVLGWAAANVFLGTSIFAALLSFHQTVARYLFTMTREGLLPQRVGRIGRSGAPVGGSLVQSGLAVMVIVVWALAGLDPMVLFTSLAALAAVGIMSLILVCCLATWGYFGRKGGGRGWVSVWVAKVAPLLGAAAMSGIVVRTVGNLHAMTGVEPGSWSVWLLPALVAAVAVAGLVWGAVVHGLHRDVAAGIGRGESEPLAVLETYLIPTGGRL